MSDWNHPLRDVLDDPIEHEALERIRRRVARSRHRSLRRGPSAWVGVAAVAAAALVAVYVSRSTQTSSPGPLRLADGARLESLAAHDATRIDSFEDGSRLTLGAGTRVEAVRNDERDVTLVMSEGRGHFFVQPGGPRRWTIDAGLATIDVVGTEFDVIRAAHSLTVDVQHGVVRVHGPRVPEGVRRLERGERLVVHDAPEPPSSAAIEEPPPAVATVAAPTPTAAPSPRIPSPAPWRQLAEEGQHAAAYSLLGRGGIATETARATVDELFALADVARLSGHPAEATPALERIIQEHASHPGASVAAFTLGRTYLDVLDRPSDAASAFARSIALGCPQTLEEQARARLVDAYERAGEGASARRSAEEYLERFPDGRHATSLASRFDLAPMR